MKHCSVGADITHKNDQRHNISKNRTSCMTGRVYSNSLEYIIYIIDAAFQ